MSQIVLKSNRDDVRALDLLFKNTEHCSLRDQVRILRFYCQSQGITGKDLFPEDYRNV